jgi:signal transduction histidine kinase
MRSLYLRIWLTLVATLALFALGGAWLVQRNLEQERAQAQAAIDDRMAAWAAFIESSLPEADAPRELQRDALLEWSHRLKLPMALDDARGERIATAARFERLERDGPPGLDRRILRIVLTDGRTLWLWRPQPRRLPGPLDGPPGAALGGPPGLMAGPDGERRGPPFDGPPPRSGRDAGGGPFGPPGAFQGPGLREPVGPGWAGWFRGGTGWGLVTLGGLLFLAVAAGAYPVVRRLTRRLEALRQGVEAFGAGDLAHRVATDGRDEVAAVAASFNQAAQRIEDLVRANRSLLANASHELRSPLARLKMAVAMMENAPDARRAGLRDEIDRDIRELDALVEEVLLASRLDARAAIADDPVDLLGLAAEECARVDAGLDAGAAVPLLRGDERLLRRALRNLLENARRYGGEEVALRMTREGPWVRLQVEDRGPGVPAELRERIFEPFYRLPGHAEQAGGVGLGLSLVRQIARAHGGEVRCEAREGGGSRFVLALPVPPGA